MICLVVSQSRLWMITIFFYTCIWIPFIEFKKALLRIVSIVFKNEQGLVDEEYQSFLNIDEQPCLDPVVRFVDLKAKMEENTCSICLVDFGKQDLVSKLSKCEHVFHMDCIENWLNSYHFTCPLCRSSFLNLNASHAKSNQPAGLHLQNYTTPTSFFGFLFFYLRQGSNSFREN